MCLEYNLASKKLVIMFLSIITLFFIQFNLVYAYDSQNTTITNISEYKFEPGFYNIVKYKETEESEYILLHKTEIPYLNLTYTSPTDGVLEVNLKPVNGSLPYIELNAGWDVNGLNYVTNVKEGDTCYMILTPPWKFTDYNSSKQIDGGTTLWEMYTWPYTEGNINYSFIRSEDIIFDIIMHPSKPSEGESIDLFTYSNVEINELKWTLISDNITWVNHTKLLELGELSPGIYYVNVEGYDELNNLHSDNISFNVTSLNMLNLYEVNFYSISCPKEVILGNEFLLSAIIDYSVSEPVKIKCVLSDQNNKQVLKQMTYYVSDSNSKLFNYKIKPEVTGEFSYIASLFYDYGDGWIEAIEPKKMSITVLEAHDTPKIPGFNLTSLSLGIIMIIIIRASRYKIYTRFKD